VRYSKNYLFKLINDLPELHKKILMLIKLIASRLSLRIATLANTKGIDMKHSLIGTAAISMLLCACNNNPSTTKNAANNTAAIAEESYTLPK
jgi:hypothetical protein